MTMMRMKRKTRAAAAKAARLILSHLILNNSGPCDRGFQLRHWMRSEVRKRGDEQPTQGRFVRQAFIDIAQKRIV